MDTTTDFIEEGTIFRIAIHGERLYLHKSSNMFTTDYRQAREYKNYKNAVKWIESRMINNEYNMRFRGLKLEIVSCEDESNVR